VPSTFDADPQRKLAALAQRERPSVGGDAEIGALITSNADRAVLAYLGGGNSSPAPPPPPCCFAPSTCCRK
jgi:hypothetical protein